MNTGHVKRYGQTISNIAYPIENVKDPIHLGLSFPFILTHITPFINTTFRNTWLPTLNCKGQHRSRITLTYYPNSGDSICRNMWVPMFHRLSVSATRLSSSWTVMNTIAIVFDKLIIHALLHWVASTLNQVKVMIWILQENHDCSKLNVVNRVIGLIIIGLSRCVSHYFSMLY